MKIKLDAKHVLSVVAVLALIGGGAGALIGTVNYFTAPVISEHDDRKELAAYYACFPDAASFSDEVEVSGGTSIESYRSALDASGNEIGKAFHAVGTTGFGAKVDLLIGVNADGLAHIEIVAYGPDNTGGNNATVEAWIESINDGSATIDGGTTTGATNTASVVREMVAEALELYENGDVPPGPVTGGEKYYNLFEGGSSAGDKVDLEGGVLNHYREVKDASGNLLGRAYYGGGVNSFGVSINVIVGVTPEGEVTKLYLDEYSGGEQMGTDTTIKNWIDEVNGGDREWTAGPSAGISYDVIKGVIEAAIADYTAVAPEPSYDDSVYLGLFEGASSLGAFRVLDGEYLTGSIEVLDADGTLLGHAYEGEGLNSFNVHIALVVGVKEDGTVTKLYLGDYSGGNPAGTEETVRDWIDGVNDGTESIETGPSAASSYPVLKGIIDEAVGYATGTIVDPSEKYLELFEGASSLGEEVELQGYDYISSYREVKDASGKVLGRGYLTITTNVGGKWGDLELLIGVTPEGAIAKVLALTNKQSRPDGTNDYIDSVNGGGSYEDIFGYESSSGTVGIEITHDAIAEAIEDYSGTASLPAEMMKAMAEIFPEAASWGDPLLVDQGDILGRMAALDAEGVETGAAFYLSGNANDGDYDLVIGVETSGDFTLSLVSGGWDSAYLEGVETWIAKINDGSAHYRDDIKDSGVNQAAYAIAANIEAVLTYEGIEIPGTPEVPATIPESVKALIPEAHSWNAYVELSAKWQATGYWAALDEAGTEIGRVYEFWGSGTEKEEHYYLALGTEGGILGLTVVNTPLEGENLTALNQWVEELNSSKTIPEVGEESAIAADLEWIKTGIEDCQRDYLGATPDSVEEKIDAFVTDSFGASAKHDAAVSVSLETVPEVTHRYGVYVPVDDPMGGTPTYPGDVYLAHVKTDSYEAYVLIAIGDLATDEVPDDAARYLVCSEEGMKDESAINKVVEALLAL